VVRITAVEAVDVIQHRGFYRAAGDRACPSDQSGSNIMAVRLAYLPGEEPPKRGNKFGAKRCHCQSGHMHDSIAEARRCNDLVMLERAGAIRNLRQQQFGSPSTVSKSATKRPALWLSRRLFL
jgi:hypothetical protein